MGFTLTAQAQGFASSLLLGFSLALAYDLLRAVRLKRRGLAFLTPLCDTLFPKMPARATLRSSTAR